MSEWNIARVQKQCTDCTTQFAEWDKYISSIREEGEVFLREDRCLECWGKRDKGDMYSYWQAVIPEREERKPENIQGMSDFFDRLVTSSDLTNEHRSVLYLTTLILIRKRRLKLINNTVNEKGEDLMQLERVRDAETLFVIDPGIRPEEIADLKIRMDELFESEFAM